MQKRIRYCKYSNVTFLSLNKKVTKEVSQRDSTKNHILWYDCHPLWKRQPVSKNVPIFERLQFKNLQVFLPAGPRKSGHFRGSDGDAAGGFLRRALFRSASLSRLLLVLFLATKKSTYQQLQECILFRSLHRRDEKDRLPLFERKGGVLLRPLNRILRYGRIFYLFRSLAST